MAATEARGPRLLGILNVTEDSFSDGGRYLDPERALAHARALLEAGADAIDVGAAASHPDAKPVPPSEEIRRLEPVLDRLLAERVAVSVDSFAPETQRYALARGVAFLNDVRGFPDARLYPELAAAPCRLIVMHQIGAGRASRVQIPPARVLERVTRFFEERIAALERAGVARERLILDPGMGLFLGSDPEASLAVLRALPELRRRFGLPLLVSVSRKSFLGALTGRAVGERQAATLAAELYAARQGVDYLRTHDVAGLRDALLVARALEAGAGERERGGDSRQEP